MKIIFFLIIFLQSSLLMAEQETQQWRCYGWKAALNGKRFDFYAVSSNSHLNKWEFDHELQILVSEPSCIKMGSQTYLVAVLSSGAHSRKIVILNPQNQTKVLEFEKTSLDDIDFEFKDSKLIIRYSKEKSIQDPSPVEEEMVWTPRT